MVICMIHTRHCAIGFCTGFRAKVLSSHGEEWSSSQSVCLELCHHHAWNRWLRVYKWHRCMKPRRPPRTNARTLLDGTKTAFTIVHASQRPFACIFKKVSISRCQRSVDAIIPCTDSKKSNLRGRNSRRNYTGGFRSWPPATCRFSTRRWLITIVKETIKKSFEK